jgi:hypothetical protein
VINMSAARGSHLIIIVLPPKPSRQAQLLRLPTGKAATGSRTR